MMTGKAAARVFRGHMLTDAALNALLSMPVIFILSRQNLLKRFIRKDSDILVPDDRVSQETAERNQILQIENIADQAHNSEISGNAEFLSQKYLNTPLPDFKKRRQRQAKYILTGHCILRTHP